MAIQSGYNKKTNTKRPESVIDSSEESSEMHIRPKTLEDYVGQTSMKKQLKVAIESAKIRQTPLEHMLFYGPPGLGKTTISLILAEQMGGQMKHTSGPAIEKQSDIVSILTGVQESDVLFIDEIHRLKPVVEEILYSAMEDFKVDIILGTGPGATSVRMDLPRFTLIGATTKLSKISNPLRDRFGNIHKLNMYEIADLAAIAQRTGSLYEMDLAHRVCEQIAQRSRGTPRITNRFVKIVRDYITIGRDIAGGADVDALFSELNIDSIGLDDIDRKLLSHLANSFGGGPVGINTLASVLGEEESTIEDVVEPFLLKEGLIERTPRGRKITDRGIRILSDGANQ